MNDSLLHFSILLSPNSDSIKLISFFLMLYFRLLMVQGTFLPIFRSLIKEGNPTATLRDLDGVLSIYLDELESLESFLSNKYIEGDLD